MPTLDLDWRLRLAAFAVLDQLRKAGGGIVTGGWLADGFEFEGQRIRFFDVRRGIWRPRQLGKDGAALTIVTTQPKLGEKPPYDDQLAAHILPDRDERGRPEVPNGLSLCKIHHAAYDANILGVAPDYLVHVRRDVLQEHDGRCSVGDSRRWKGTGSSCPGRPRAGRIPGIWKSATRGFGRRDLGVFLAGVIGSSNRRSKGGPQPVLSRNGPPMAGIVRSTGNGRVNGCA